jgi:hypothetical protein
MPTVYRAMKKAEDGFPSVENGARGLGVREPPSAHADIDVDAAGNVVVNGRGMSVARHWRDLPTHRIPERLDNGEVGATGPNSDYCWKLGQGGFSPAAVGNRLVLALKPGSTTRGNVAPSAVVSLGQFQSDLAATRPGWTVDER